jgi:hypothetical protein
VSVYRAVRSRVIPAGCVATDDNGRGALSFRSEGGDYLVMVGRERDSDDGKFKLTTFRQEPSSKLPAPALPGSGVSSWVEPISDFDDAFSLRMKAGVEYRVNLSPARGRCVSLTLFAPGTRSLAGAAPIRSVPCGGYLTYTPGLGGGGRYTLLVTATDERPGRQRYHLQAALAGPDDAAPGLPLQNLQTRRGTLSGTHVDVVDLYRFKVTERSDVTLTLAGPSRFRLVVLPTAADVSALVGRTGPADGESRPRDLLHRRASGVGSARPLRTLAAGARADDHVGAGQRFPQRLGAAGCLGRDRGRG